jgi:hypothetical protein
VTEPNIPAVLIAEASTGITGATTGVTAGATGATTDATGASTGATAGNRSDTLLGADRGFVNEIEVDGGVTASPGWPGAAGATGGWGVSGMAAVVPFSVADWAIGSTLPAGCRALSDVTSAAEPDARVVLIG